MKKPFLLIMGDNFYPSEGTGDWRGTYESYEEAEADIETFKKRGLDWYKIVDLRDWKDGIKQENDRLCNDSEGTWL